jgi:hypothetical protein
VTAPRTWAGGVSAYSAEMTANVAIPRSGTERDLLDAHLRRLRTLVDWKLRDCDDGRLRSTVTPGGMYAHGVVRHLENVDRWWFRGIFLGEPDLTYDWTEADPDAEFKPDAPIGELLDAYACEWRRCEAAVAGISLDEPARGTPPGEAVPTLRWVLLHVIEEVARHLGHLDLLREQADGARGDQPRS